MMLQPYRGMAPIWIFLSCQFRPMFAQSLERTYPPLVAVQVDIRVMHISAEFHIAGVKTFVEK